MVGGSKCRVLMRVRLMQSQICHLTADTAQKNIYILQMKQYEREILNIALGLTKPKKNTNFETKICRGIAFTLCVYIY